MEVRKLGEKSWKNFGDGTKTLALAGARAGRVTW